MRFEGIVYRALDPRWHYAPMSGEGARINGGRFNPRGQVALYTAMTLATAIREVQRLGGFQPVTLVALQVDIDGIVDSRSDQELAHYGVAAADLLYADWGPAGRAGIAPSQAASARLISAGVSGLIVNSFAQAATPDDLNLVLWRWGPDLPHRVRVIDDQGRLGLTPRPRA